MKVGDLVKMKPNLHRRPGYHRHGLVYGIAGPAIKVLMHNNNIKAGLLDQWEVVSECGCNESR